MPNDYYNHGVYPTPNSPGSSAQLRSELDSITTGFSKLPTLTGNGYKLIRVNSAGTALEATTALPTLDVIDTGFFILDDADNTKKARFETSGISAGTTRTYTFPDASTTIVGTDAAQTLTNKTISGAANTISNVSLTTAVTGTLPIGNGGTGFTSVTANGALYANGAGTAISSGTLPIASGGTGAITAAAARVNILPSFAGNAGKTIIVNPGETDIQFVPAAGVGTVTSVGVTSSNGSLIIGGTNPITGSGTIDIILGTPTGPTTAKVYFMGQF